MTDDREAIRGFEDEDEHDRLHRRLDELLESMRVALPGVQVLFAFLLTVPFQQRFNRVGSFGHGLYLAALLLAAAAVGLLIGPSAYHRVQFRTHDLDHTITVGQRMALAGFACLALAIACAVTLAASMLTAQATAIALGLGTLALLATLWFALPIARRVRERG
jgi:hypothetical protein